MATANTTIRVRRGLKANLPASAALGEILLTTDTNELFRGTGAAVVPIEIDVANVLGLLSGGKIDPALLPALALTEVYVVADIAARDALTPQEGDVAVVADASGDPAFDDPVRKSYIYTGSDWTLLNDSDGVGTVNGQTGDVVLDTDDVDEGVTNLYYTDARVLAYLTANNYLKDDDDIKRLGSGSDADGAGVYGAGPGNSVVLVDDLDGGTF